MPPYFSKLLNRFQQNFVGKFAHTWTIKCLHLFIILADIRIFEKIKKQNLKALKKNLYTLNLCEFQNDQYKIDYFC